MKITLIGRPETIMSNPESLHNYFGWPTVARLKNGELAVGASGFRLRHVCPFGKAVIAKSRDEGKSWSLPMPVIDTPLDDRDAGLCPFGESGLIMTSFNNSVAQQDEWSSGHWYTEDVRGYIKGYLGIVHGDAEKKYLGATFKISYDNGESFGKTFISPVTSPHGPIELSDGSILWVGRPFSETDKFGKCDKVAAYRLKLDGTMEKLGEIENPESLPGVDSEKGFNCCEPYTFEAADGRLICHLRVEPGLATYQSESVDGGKTWSKPEMFLPAYGGAPSHIFRHSSGVLVAVTGYRKGPYGIDAHFSRDEGKTWEKNYRIYENDVSWDLGYPSSVELSDGSILTVFYATPEKDGATVIMQQRWSFE